MNILRQLIDPEAYKQDKAMAVFDAALKVQRAGLTHLVQGSVSEFEVNALAMASETIAVERALLGLSSREDLLAYFDGGETVRRVFLRRALERAKAGDA